MNFKIGDIIQSQSTKGIYKILEIFLAADVARAVCLKPSEGYTKGEIYYCVRLSENYNHINFQKQNHPHTNVFK